MSKKLTLQYFIDRSEIIHNYKYDYSLSNYSGSNKKLIIKCKLHGDFLQTPACHLKGQGCKKCQYDLLKTKFSHNLSIFIEKANLVHNYEFDYSDSHYINTDTKIKIFCKKHNLYFYQTPHNHLNGEKCKKCGLENLINKQKISYADFFERAKHIHGDKYKYINQNIINVDTKIKIICSIHGEFLQTPWRHLLGNGCKKCANYYNAINRTKKIQDFITETNKIHNNLYDYSKSLYIKSSYKIEIICPKHNSFLQTPNNHLNGSGCPSCAHNVSKKERKWVNSFNNKNIIKNYSFVLNGKTIKTDGFDPITNTIYEFNGDFWHGNPTVFSKDKINNVVKKTFEELYLKTINKERLLKEAGYNVISIWEFDFDKIL